MSERRDPVEEAWGVLESSYVNAAREMTGRFGVGVFVHDSTRVSAPGWTDIATSTVHVRRSLIPGGPLAASRNVAEARRGLAVSEGVFCHEIGHVMHSAPWEDYGVDLKDASVMEALELLEEIRMEARVAEGRPEDVIWLRCAVKSILLDGDAATSATSLRAVISQVVLLLGRAVGGSVPLADVASVVPPAEAALGAEKLGKLIDLCGEAVRVGDADVPALGPLAEQLAAMLDEAGPPEKPRGCCSSGRGRAQSSASGAGTSGGGSRQQEPASDGESDGESDAATLSAAISALTDAVAEAAGTAAALARASQEGQERSEELAADLAHQIAAEEAKAALAGLDTNPQTLRLAAVAAGRARGNPYNIGERAETAADATEKQRMIRALRSARFRERTVTHENRADPPGRLRVNGAVQLAARRSAGEHGARANLFERRLVRHSEEPLLSVGIAVDLSGSMRDKAGLLAKSVYSVTRAVESVGGIVAVAAFGDAFQPITGPGKRMTRVPVFTPKGGTQHLPRAMTYLAGAANLYVQRNVRMLLVLSDGDWLDGDEVDARMTTLTAAGCTVGVIDLPPFRSSARANAASWTRRVTDVTALADALLDVAAEGYRRAA